MSLKKFEEMNIVELIKIEAKNPSILVGIPDVGLVGSIVASHIIEALNMSELGYVESEILPPVMLVHKNEPKFPVRIFGLNELVVLSTEVILPPQTLFYLSKAIVSWAKRLNANFLVGMTGIGVPNRLEVEKPTAYGVGSSEQARKLLKEANIPPFEQGILAGIYALLMKECMRNGLSNITLLAESHLEFPDPGAAVSIINSLNSLFGINADVKTLLEKEEEIRIKARELMRNTKEQMRSMRKVQEDIRGIYV